MEEYHIFISYSRTDVKIVRPLVQLLRLTEDQIFRDSENIPPGSRWQAIIISAIEGCSLFLLFWCRHSANSVEVKKEYDKALELNKSIVPLLLDDTHLPIALAEFQGIDLRPILGGHDEYDTLVQVTIPSWSPFFRKTRLEHRRQLVIPEEAVLFQGGQYLKNILGEKLRASEGRA
jgi:TIR domain